MIDNNRKGYWLFLPPGEASRTLWGIQALSMAELEELMESLKEEYDYRMSKWS